MKCIFFLSWLAAVWLMSACENGAGEWTGWTSLAIALFWLAAIFIKDRRRCEVMAYYDTCPNCGANLDPGEKCDCICGAEYKNNSVRSEIHTEPKNVVIRPFTIHTQYTTKR